MKKETIFGNVSNGVVVIKNVRTIVDVESCISMGFTRFKAVDSNSRWFF